MKNNRMLLLAANTLVIVILLGGCANATDSSTELDNLSQKNNTPIDTAYSSSKADSTDITSNIDTMDTDNNKVESKSNDDPVKEEGSSTDANTTGSLKEEYLKKLNEMEEADRNGEVGTTIAELEEQEFERYNKWDEELNQIYAVLQEQLSREEMNQLREKQRNWISYRDQEAKELSLKYKGGSTESLEYVATQASLTRERCYELVANYMK
ncbi:DUF1311 domain-containing protein [Evansella sp. AB-P1]|uniref:lysozyme inhibitor LprI family protein n=1 Tax=Evansella sp. AB-P1 TaxID=3037653 RepID=UPI00241D98AD|nr:lysozyme inhibitor LprI family protein [Evansella sp. AB-P1]MDG5789918.1 DUF1311 domain-containing protein [Evansella sp. AB-P1]